MQLSGPRLPASPVAGAVNYHASRRNIPNHPNYGNGDSPSWISMNFTVSRRFWISPRRVCAELKIVTTVTDMCECS